MLTKKLSDIRRFGEDVKYGKKLADEKRKEMSCKQNEYKQRKVCTGHLTTSVETQMIGETVTLSIQEECRQDKKVDRETSRLSINSEKTSIYKYPNVI